MLSHLQLEQLTAKIMCNMVTVDTDNDSLNAGLMRALRVSEFSEFEPEFRQLHLQRADAYTYGCHVDCAGMAYAGTREQDHW